MSSTPKRVAALAGVGAVGYHVLEAIVASQNWTPVILSRAGSNKSFPFSTDVAPVVEVNYDDVHSLAEALKEHKAEVVISFISIPRSPTGAAHAKAHESLIKAAEEAGVKRFIPSEWGLDVKANPDRPRSFETGKQEPRTILAKSSLEYTLIGTGLFTDYLLPKGTKKYLTDFPFPINPETHSARIPGDENVPAVFATADDVGRAVGSYGFSINLWVVGRLTLISEEKERL